MSGRNGDSQQSIEHGTVANLNATIDPALNSSPQVHRIERKYGFDIIPSHVVLASTTAILRLSWLINNTGLVGSRGCQDLRSWLSQPPHSNSTSPHSASLFYLKHKPSKHKFIEKLNIRKSEPHLVVCWRMWPMWVSALSSNSAFFLSLIPSHLLQIRRTTDTGYHQR